MKLSTLLATIISGATLALAIPQAVTTTSAAPTTSPSIYPNSSREFYLRTDLKVEDPSKERFNGLYLYSYHTGAGLSDVTFAANKTAYAAQGWINYTSGDVGQLTFNLHTAFPWTMSADYSSYRQFSPMYINAGQGGPQGFYINETGLVWNDNYKLGTNASESSFGGWLGKAASRARDNG